MAVRAKIKLVQTLECAAARFATVLVAMVQFCIIPSKLPEFCRLLFPYQIQMRGRVVFVTALPNLDIRNLDCLWNLLD